MTRLVKIVERSGYAETVVEDDLTERPTIELELADNERILDFELDPKPRRSHDDPITWRWVATIEISGPTS